MKIHQISSATFLRLGAWVATVMSAASISDFHLFYRYYNFITVKIMQIVPLLIGTAPISVS